MNSPNNGAQNPPLEKCNILCDFVRGIRKKIILERGIRNRQPQKLLLGLNLKKIKYRETSIL